jgi:hypothetical protein
MDEGQKGPNIVKLNIGGTIFITTKETLLSIPGTTFHGLLSNEKYQPDFEGCFFFDRSPKYFEEILNYLRTNSMDWEIFQTSTSQIAISKELDFYGFQSMIHESSISEDAYKIFNNISKQLSDNKNNLHFNQLMKFEQNVSNIKEFEKNIFIQVKNEGTLIINDEKMTKTSLSLDLTTLIELKNGNLASADGPKIFIWKDENLISSLIGHTRSVRSLIQLSSGIIVSSSYDKTIKFWNENGTCCKTIETDEVCYNLVKYSNDTVTFVSGAGEFLKNIEKDYSIKDFSTDLFSNKNFTWCVMNDSFGFFIKEEFKTILRICGENGNLKLSHPTNAMHFHKSSIQLKNGKFFTIVSDNNFSAFSISIFNENGKFLKVFPFPKNVNSLIELDDGKIASQSENEIKIWDLDGICHQTIFSTDGSVFTEKSLLLYKAINRPSFQIQ